MTNGEKLKQICPEWLCLFSKSWLDSEYKEPTTKNDLGVDKPVILDWNNCHTSEQLDNISTTKNNLGVDTDKLISDCEKMSFDIEIFNKPLKVVALDAVKNIVKEMPTVTPQEPKSEWQKDHEILKAYSDGANEVLDKIRAEIHATAEMHEDGDYYLRDEWIDEIFDKYKAESEG